MPSQRGTSLRAGFGLVELTISSLILILLLMVVGLTGRTNVKSYQFTADQQRNDVALERALSRIASEFFYTGAARINPDPALNAMGFEIYINFDQVVDLVAGAPVWGPVTRIAFEYDVTEFDDGIDNDGDGLVDEGRVVMTKNVGGIAPTRTVLLSNVAEYSDGELPNGVDDNGNGLRDEGGFYLLRKGDVLDIALTVVGIDPSGNTFTRSVETSARMRN